MSDGVGGKCIIEGLGLELIKENSLVSVTCHFKVVEYFKRALFLRGNEIQTKSAEEEEKEAGYVCFCHRSGAEMEDLKMWSRLLGSEAVWGPIFTAAEASASHKHFI